MKTITNTTTAATTPAETTNSKDQECRVAPPIQLWVAIYHDTDGFTYDADIVLGVYSERSKADERCLKDSAIYSWRKLDEYRVDEHRLNEDWE